MKNLIKRILLGILLGAILTPATTQAQFTVFDPAQYALHLDCRPLALSARGWNFGYQQGAIQHYSGVIMVIILAWSARKAFSIVSSTGPSSAPFAFC